MTEPVSDGEKILLPENDVKAPEITIAIPALDEELCIGEFIDWCWQGLAQANVVGEILIIDSGSDRSAEIALAKGARVLKPRAGAWEELISMPFPIYAENT